MVSITVRGNDLLYRGYETGAYGDVAGLGFGVNLLVVVVVVEGMDKEMEYLTVEVDGSCYGDRLRHALLTSSKTRMYCNNFSVLPSSSASAYSSLFS